MSEIKSHTHYQCYGCGRNLICQRSEEEKIDEMKANFGDLYPRQNAQENNDMVSICDDCYENYRETALLQGIDLK